MTHERDERWAYVAIAALAVLYILYRTEVLSMSTKVNLRMPSVDLGRFAKSVPYLAAPLFAVLSEVWRRRKARAARREWEARARAEGLLREQEDVQVRFVSGAKGTMKSDVLLTRAGLYLFDRSGRRDAMRFSLTDDRGPLRMVDVSAGRRDSAGVPAIRVKVDGDVRLEFEFPDPSAGGWEADIRAASGQRARKSEKSDPNDES